MTTIYEPTRLGDVLKYDDEDRHTREVVTIKAGADLALGTVLGKISKGGAVTVGAAVFAGTGNGVLTKATPAYGAGAQAGTYTVRFVEKTTDSGEFEVVRPDGTVDGFGVIGTAYDGQVKFTIADGATDFDQTSVFTIPVTIAANADLGKYKALDPAAVDGSADAAGVLLVKANAASADVADVVILARGPAGLADAHVIWPVGISASAKAAAIAQLNALSIVIRNEV